MPPAAATQQIVHFAAFAPAGKNACCDKANLYFIASNSNLQCLLQIVTGFKRTEELRAT
jgi:hypothetical protein